MNLTEVSCASEAVSWISVTAKAQMHLHIPLPAPSCKELSPPQYSSLSTPWQASSA